MISSAYRYRHVYPGTSIANDLPKASYGRCYQRTVDSLGFSRHTNEQATVLYWARGSGCPAPAPACGSQNVQSHAFVALALEPLVQDGGELRLSCLRLLFAMFFWFESSFIVNDGASSLFEPVWGKSSAFSTKSDGRKRVFECVV